MPCRKSAVVVLDSYSTANSLIAATSHTHYTDYSLCPLDRFSPSATMQISYSSLFVLALFGTIQPAPALPLNDNLAGRQAVSLSLLPTSSYSTPTQPTSTGPPAGNSNGGVQNGNGQTNNNGPSGGSDNGSNNPICTYSNLDTNTCDDADSNGDLSNNTLNISPSVSV